MNSRELVFLAMKSAPTEEVVALLNHEANAWMTTSLLMDNRVPPKVLAGMINSKQPIRCSLAANSSTLPETIAILAFDEDEEVRAYLMLNQMLKKEIIVKLAADNSRYVRNSLLKDKRVSSRLKQQIRWLIKYQEAYSSALKSRLSEVNFDQINATPEAKVIAFNEVAQYVIEHLGKLVSNKRVMKF